MTSSERIIRSLLCTAKCLYKHVLERAVRSAIYTYLFSLTSVQELQGWDGNILLHVLSFLPPIQSINKFRQLNPKQTCLQAFGAMVITFHHGIITSLGRGFLPLCFLPPTIHSFTADTLIFKKYKSNHDTHLLKTCISFHGMQNKMETSCKSAYSTSVILN